MTQGGEGPRAVWRRQVAHGRPDDPTGEGDDNVTYFKVHGARADDVWMVGTRVEPCTGTEPPWRPSPSMPTHPRPRRSSSPSTPTRPTRRRGRHWGGLILEYDGSVVIEAPTSSRASTASAAQVSSGRSGKRSPRAEPMMELASTWTWARALTYDDWHGCGSAEWRPLGRGRTHVSRPPQSRIIGSKAPSRPLPTAW